VNALKAAEALGAVLIVVGIAAGLTMIPGGANLAVLGIVVFTAGRIGRQIRAYIAIHPDKVIDS
jgi:hypothetical protein